MTGKIQESYMSTKASTKFLAQLCLPSSQQLFQVELPIKVSGFLITSELWISQSLQLKKLAPSEPGTAASSAQWHRGYREASFLTAFILKRKKQAMRDGGGEHDRRVTDHVLSVYLLTPLSLPPPVSSEESRKGKEAYDLVLGDRGAPLGMELLNLSHQRTCIFREN